MLVRKGVAYSTCIAYTTFRERVLGSGNWIGGGRHKPCTVVSANYAFDAKECLAIFRVSSTESVLQLSRESPTQIC